MTARDGPGAAAFGSLRAAAGRPLGYWGVRLVSWSLVAVAAILAAVFALHIGKFEATAPSRPATQSEAPEANVVVVTGSTLAGVDRDRQPYAVTAGSAVQDSAEPGRIRLLDVAGQLRRTSGEVLSLAARTALYDSRAEVLQLDGEVSLITAGRFVADMAKAEVALAEKRLRSDVPVTVRFDRGEIAAGGLEITDDGNRIVFFNRVNVVFGPSSKGDRQQ